MKKFVPGHGRKGNQTMADYNDIRSSAAESRSERNSKYAKGGAVHDDEAQDRKLISSMMKKEDKAEKRADGGAIQGLKRGGKANRPGSHRTIVNVISAPGGGGQPPPRPVPYPFRLVPAVLRVCHLGRCRLECPLVRWVAWDRCRVVLRLVLECRLRVVRCCRLECRRGRVVVRSRVGRCRAWGDWIRPREASRGR